MKMKKLLRKSLCLLLALSMILSIGVGVFAADAVPQYEGNGKDFLMLDFFASSGDRELGWTAKTHDKVNQEVAFNNNDYSTMEVVLDGHDSYIMMPNDNVNRLNYTLKENDVVLVKLKLTKSSQDFTNKEIDSQLFYTLVDGKDSYAEDCSVKSKISYAEGEQTVEFAIPETHFNKVLRNLRLDVFGEDVAAKVSIDYIYVGPESKLPPRYDATKTLYTGEKIDDDLFSLQLEAFQYGLIDETKTGVPLDVTIVLDRSQSMSQPASDQNVDQHNVFKGFKAVYPGAILTNTGTNGKYGVTFNHNHIVVSNEMQTKINELNAFLKTLDTNAYEGYYRATNILKRNAPYFANNHVGFAANGYASWEPMRYNKTSKQWEVRITTGVWGEDFPGGINTIEYVGDITNRQYQWVSMEYAYKEYCARNRRHIYCTENFVGTNNPHDMRQYYDFVIATPRLTKAIDATEVFIRSIYNSGTTLPAGQSHRVSILSFGTGVFYNGGRYGYNGYDSVSDNNIRMEGTLEIDLGVSKAVTNLNTTANLNSVIDVLRNHYTYTNTYTHWALEAVETETQFLPDKETGRKQVVILITDGAPTTRDNMEGDVANRALLAAKKLKTEGVQIYTIGFMKGLDEKDPTDFNNSDPGSPANANSFLYLLSSLYPAAESVATTEHYYLDTKDNTYFWTVDRYRFDENSRYVYQNQTRPLAGAGNKADTENPFYLADDGTGAKLRGIFDTMKSYIIESSCNPYFDKAEHLTMYDEITREFKLDTDEERNRTIDVYATPYGGNHKFDEKELLGKHSIILPTEEKPVVTINGPKGDGKDPAYTITLTKEGEITKVKLDWLDAESAYLRETNSVTGGCYYKNYPLGYKLMMEIPLEVDRENTFGGNNIKTNTTASGFYQTVKDETTTNPDDTKEEIIHAYPVPNANVTFKVPAEVYDYFMDLEEYVALMEDGKISEEEFREIVEAMFQSLEEYMGWLSNGVNEYLDLTIEWKDALGEILDGWFAGAGADEFTDKETTAEPFDLLVDQILSLVVTLSPREPAEGEEDIWNVPDSCQDDYLTEENGAPGVPAWTEQTITLHPNYYGPKFVVIDFDETVKVPLSNESGLNPTLAENVKNGYIEEDDLHICYDLRDNYGNDEAKQYLEEVKAIDYTVEAVNTPKDMEKPDEGKKTIVSRTFHVFPANVMTYDDTLLTYIKDKEEKDVWETLGTFEDKEQSHDNRDTHGYDKLYEGEYSKEYYHNDLHMVTVSKEEGKGVAQATFTIQGTGFDIFAQTSKNAGMMAVEVCRIPTQAEIDALNQDNKDSSTFADAFEVRRYVVDTYLAEQTLNQIPVVHCEDLPYGTYNIRITAFYDRIFDHNYTKSMRGGIPTEETLRQRYNVPEHVEFTFIPSASGYDHPVKRAVSDAVIGQYNLYIDGIRVYNTLGDEAKLAENALATYAYSIAKEGYGKILNMNDALIDAGTAETWKYLDSTSKEIADGVLYAAGTNKEVNFGEDYHGVIIGMDGTLCAGEPEMGKYYVYTDDTKQTHVTYNGGNVYFRKGKVTAPNGTTIDSGLNFYYDGGSKTVPMTNAQIKAAFGNTPMYYNAKYSATGPEKEIYLESGHGVAFKASAVGAKTMISYKAIDDNGGKLAIYNTKTGKFETLSDAVTRVEMYFDLTDYINSKDGYVILQCTEGKVSICNIKTVGVATTEEEGQETTSGVSVDLDLVKLTTKLFKNAGLPVDGEADIKHSLNLASDISLNYAVSAEKLADYDFSYMEVLFNGRTYMLEPEVRGNFAYFTVEGITAVEMTEKLEATLHMFLGEEEFISETDVYSVADYAYSCLNNKTATADLKAVCANLLRYGAKAQSYKGSEAVMADAAMTAEQKTYLTDLNTVSAVNAAEALADVEGVAWVGKTLVLDSKVAVKAIFNLKNFTGNMAALNLRVSYVDMNGEVQNAVVTTMDVYNEANGLYSFTYDELMAADMRALLTMALYEGDVQVSETHIYSVESYCAARTGVLAELGKALLAYSDAAKAYLTK